jgi:AraC-like DNA-binding protein
VLAQQPDRASQRRAVHLLEGVLLDLAEHRIVQPKTEPWIDRAMTRLSESEIDCPSLATELGVSESTFRRHFQEATGVSPVEFRIQQRIGSARRLLSETGDPIKTIASKLGYRDVFFFTRQFTRRVGVSPAVYRKSRQG